MLPCLFSFCWHALAELGNITWCPDETIIASYHLIHLCITVLCITEFLPSLEMLFLLHYYVAFIDLAPQQTSSSGDSKCAHVHHYILNGTSGKGLVDDNNKPFFPCKYNNLLCLGLNEALIHWWHAVASPSSKSVSESKTKCGYRVCHWTWLLKTDRLWNSNS